MRNYLKILAVTLTIQIIMVVIGLLLWRILKLGSHLMVIFLFWGYFFSLIVDVYMSVKMGATIYKKLIYIFFMLSNYTPLILFWVAIQMSIKFFEMLPKDLG